MGAIMGRRDANIGCVASQARDVHVISDAGRRIAGRLGSSSYKGVARMKARTIVPWRLYAAGARQAGRARGKATRNGTRKTGQAMLMTRMGSG